MKLYDTAQNPDGGICLSLPIPDRAISPNGQRGQSKWAAIQKSKIVKQHRLRAHSLMADAIARYGLRGMAWKGYRLAFYFKTSRFRDDDNADASCKAYRDGCASALGMDDRNLKKIALSTQAKDAKNPRVEITLFPV